MRTAKTHVRQHNKEKFELLHDSSVPLIQQSKSFKLLRSEEVNDKIAEVHYQESDGPLRTAHFITPAEKKNRDETTAKAAAANKAHSEKLAKEAAAIKSAKDKKLSAVEKANVVADKKAREAAKHNR